jgi:hypothetical protein
MGAVGLEWTVAGFGDFSGNAGETDMLMRNNNTGAFEIYDIATTRSRRPRPWVRSDWSGWLRASAISAAIPARAMLLRNSHTGAFEVYDISHNTITAAASIGQVALEWTVAGFAATNPSAGSGTSAALIGQLAQAMASLGASAAINSASGAVPGGSDTSQQTLPAIPH